MVWPFNRALPVSRPPLAEPLPAIILNTLPKSGSIYIGRTLADGLGIKYSLESISHGFFPNYYIIPNKLLALSKESALRQEHFDPNPVNLQLLKKWAPRIILNVRDPRQATLSWLHHANRLAREHPDGINYTIHELPDGYLGWPIERQLDWQIDTHLVSAVGWLRNWFDWIDSDHAGPKVLVTRLEDLVADEQAFFERILEFLRIPKERFVYRPPEKTITHNYRLGATDE